jgi:hypothetical protein
MKKFRLVLTVVLLVANAMLGTAFAQTDDNKTGNEKAFQEIRDKLNAEYGTNARPATDEELKMVGLSRADVQEKNRTLSPADYEAELRKSIENEKKISQEALEKAAKAGISEKDFKPVSTPDPNHRSNPVYIQTTDATTKIN